MTAIYILGTFTVCGAVWLLLNQRLARSRLLPMSRAPSAATAFGGELNADSAEPAAAADAPMNMGCAALDGLHILSSEQIAPERRAAIAQALGSVPRPPRALHQLISLDFVSRASSVELGSLFMTEPFVVTKVLAKVNSPLYGIQKPVTKIGQAITFLGMTSVRNVCLRYLLDESFKGTGSAMRKIFDEIGEASSFAAELCARLAKQIDVPDQASLTTQIVLSFTGHLAVAMIQCRDDGHGNHLRSTSLLDRFRHQQAECGLAAPEIGRLLMQAWKLPAELVDQVAAIDGVLVKAASPKPSAEARGRAIGYLCARLGERFARDEISPTDDLSKLMDADPDFHHLRGYFDQASLTALRSALRSPGLLQGLKE
jgi:HD-like signal output (HDOD) protein